MGKKDEKGKYRLTPRGFLRVLTGSDEVWVKLNIFIEQQCTQNGMNEGIPCLIFEGGGHCVTVEKMEDNSDAKK